MGAKSSKSPCASFVEHSDGFAELPNELKWRIASYLSFKDGLLTMRLVCSPWNLWIIDYLSTIPMSARFIRRTHPSPKFAINDSKPHTLKELKKLPHFYHIANLNSYEEHWDWDLTGDEWNAVVQFMSLPPCQNLNSIAIPSIPTDEQVTPFCERIRKLPNLQYIRLRVKNDQSFMVIHDELIQKGTLQSIKFDFPYDNQLDLTQPIINMFKSSPLLDTMLLNGYGTYTDDLVENLVADLINRPRRMYTFLPVRHRAAHNIPLILNNIRLTQIGEAFYHMTSDGQYTVKITSTHKNNGDFQIHIKMAPSYEFNGLKKLIVEEVIKCARSMGNENARRRIATKVSAHFGEQLGLVYDIKLDAIKLKRDMSLVRIDQNALQSVLNGYIRAIFQANVHIMVHIMQTISIALI